MIGWLYDFAGRRVEKGELGERRHELVGKLEGAVLEVGAGTGLNGPFVADLSASGRTIVTALAAA